MARTHRDVVLPVLPHDAWALARNSGIQIPSFSLSGQDPASFRLMFHRGFGWSNPIDVTVTVWQSGPAESTLRYEASLLALADPFGFMDKNLERFQQHLLAHHHAWLTGSPLPLPPVDTHSAKVNLVIIAIVLGLFVLFGLFVVVVAIAR
jgi:hypothetical protein